MPGGYKRRQILVDPELQVGLSVHILGWLYFYVVMFALLANATSVWAVFFGSPRDPEYFESVQRLQWFTQFTVLPLAATFVVVAVHGVVFTHRIAGPIYRIKVTLRDMAQRKFPATPVHLRTNDYFKDVAAELSTAIDSLREDASRQRRMNQETAVGARDLVEAIESGSLSREDLLAKAHLVLDRAERMDRHLASVLPEGEAAPAPLAPTAPVAVEATSVTPDSAK